MSNTNNNMQTQTSSALHNAIMEAGGKDHPPMLALSNYNPPCQYKFKATDADATPVTPGNDEDIQKYITVEAVQIILTGIDNDIYSTVDACPNDDESLDSYYSRFYKIMNKLVRNQCIVTNHQVNDQFLLQLKPKWQRFMTIVKQNQDLKNVSYHKLYDILQQHHNEVNEIRAEILAQPEANADDEASSKDKEIDKLMALILISFKKIYKPTINKLRTSSTTRNINVDNTPRSNREIWYARQTGQHDNQRAVNISEARENVGAQVVQETGIQCYNCKEFRHVARESDWRDETDDKPEDQELEAHYMYMAKIQEVTPDDADNSGPIFDTEPLQKVWNQVKGVAGLASSNASIYDTIDDIIPFAARKTSKSINAKLVVAATSYFIWQERNGRLFKNNKRTVNQVVDCIMNTVRLKLMSCRLKKSRSACDIVKAWNLSEGILIS
ncbi:hypothetical protein Tco_1474169 [Tanacetum coccineum]